MRKSPREAPNASSPLEGLRLQIKRTEAELIARQGNDSDNSSDEMAVLFTGNWHDSVPRRLILDASMTPTERLIWMVIRSTIGDASRPGSVPRRAELASLAGCSNTTITTSREVLRINRWTTHCRTVRNRGRFVGDIYLLHDEPLSLASTLELDPGYIDFLERLVNGASKTTRVRQLAANILREIDAMNAPVVPPTETEVIANRMLHWQFGAGAKGSVINGSAHQEQILTPVKAAEVTQSNLFACQPKPTSRSMPTTRHQEQNLTPVAENPIQGQKASNSGEFLADLHQGEKLTPVIDPESDQGEFLTSGVFSSLCFRSSSLNKNINNARAREETNQPIKKPSRSLHRPEIPGQLSTPKPTNPGKNPDEDWLKTYDDEPTLPDLMGLQQLIIRHLPDISNPCLADYQRVLLATRQSQIPQLARILRPLPKNQRRNVLFQLLGKAASDWHGWSVRHLSNVVAYCKALADLAANDDLKLDDYAIELIRCADSNRKPYFESTIDRQTELNQMDRASKDAAENMR